MKFTPRHIIRFVCAVLLLACIFLDAKAAKQWERIAPAVTETVDPAVADQYDVRVVDGAVVLSVNRKRPVKIFTILGQLVAEQQLEPGVWRLSISVRGIYILKIGDTTRRITI